MINVIKAIEEKLQTQATAIYIRDLEIENLKKKLAEAEQELAELKGEGATE